MSSYSIDDLRAAVAANILTEEQAARLRVLSEQRLGFRNGLRADDEPFELFRGFSEIFITVGLMLLFGGALMILAVFSTAGSVPFLTGLFAFLFAFYFTRQRRMTLPSIWLATVYAGSVGLFLGINIIDPIRPSETDVLIINLAGMAAMGLWYGVFRLPFAMFLLGLYGLGVAFSLAAMAHPSALGFVGLADGVFDMNDSPIFALAMLLFGLTAFVAGMVFDMRDPYRISRHSTTGFWLHVLAAPAIVNTVGLTFYNMGDTTGYALTALAVLVIALVALVIDRRSFLTAAILYMGLLLAWLFQDSDTLWSIILTLLALGTFITVLGTWWGQFRAGLMRALPAFPLKNRLPPYQETA